MTDWRMRPARDQGMTPGQRLRSHERERGVGSLLVSGGWAWLVRAYLRLAHRLDVAGRENLPAAPFVMVANHSSHLDALTLAAALPGRLRRRAFALAAGDTFFTSAPAAAFAAYAVNALPVWRSKTSAQDLDGLRRRLIEDGAVLILFPEGTRSLDGSMGRFKPGVGALVAGRGIPVVPCWLEGAFAAWPKGRRLPRPGQVRLVIGPPLTFEDATGRVGLRAVAEACEAAVRGLAP